MKEQKLLDLVVALRKAQGVNIRVTSHRHLAMKGEPGWKEDVDGIVVGVAERVHNGPGITRDLILVKRGSGRLYSINLSRIITWSVEK